MITFRLAAQRPDRDIGPHFEGVESFALRVAVDAGVLPAVAWVVGQHGWLTCRLIRM